MLLKTQNLCTLWQLVSQRCSFSCPVCWPNIPVHQFFGRGDRAQEGSCNNGVSNMWLAFSNALICHQDNINPIFSALAPCRRRFPPTGQPGFLGGRHRDPPLPPSGRGWASTSQPQQACVTVSTLCFHQLSLSQQGPDGLDLWPKWKARPQTCGDLNSSSAPLSGHAFRHSALLSRWLWSPATTPVLSHPGLSILSGHDRRVWGQHDGEIHALAWESSRQW